MRSGNGCNLVSMRGITKSFLGVKANDGIDFDVRAGEVHTLLGENGAGKSTLMNVLCGLYSPEAGSIHVGDVERVFRSPRDAIAAGIGMVHQHFMLVPAQTVWENMVLGLEHQRFVLPKKEIVQRIESISQQYGLSVDPHACVWQLSVGEQQRVALLRALYRNARILILDEPTSVLTPQEATALFATLRRMVGEGHGLVFISHKLDEVMRLSSRITVLRKGQVIGTVNAADTSRERLAEMMVGRTVVYQTNLSTKAAGAVALEARNLRVQNDRDLPAVRGVSLILRQGEIFGLAGVSGNGQRELCQALVGLRSLVSGEIFLDGRNMTGCGVRDFLKEGVSYIPADRKGTGLVPNMNLRENYALRKYWKPEFTRRRWLVDWEAIAGKTGEAVARYQVKAASFSVPIRTLSGGNLQKLMLARELSDNPRVIVAVQPTWGLDVGATQYVREQLLAQRERGAAVLLVSEDLEEALALSDRLGVIHQGAIMGVVDNPRCIGEETLGLMMAGTPLAEALPKEAKACAC